MLLRIVRIASQPAVSGDTRLQQRVQAVDYYRIKLAFSGREESEKKK